MGSGVGNKPNSVPGKPGGDHSSRTTVYPPSRATYPEASDGPSSNASLFGLAPDGVYLASRVTTRTGELLPHLFTLTSALRRRFAFCGTFLGVTPTGRYPASCPVEFGLSSRARCAGDRLAPPDTARYMTTERRKARRYDIIQKILEIPTIVL